MARPERSDSGPLVSVLTPSFNQAAWLRDNLGSVACQTYPRIEHVVMDGGSTDDSPKILAAAAAASAAGGSVKWRSERDRGQSHALNKAFAASTGEIIGWLNSDDAYFDCGVVEAVVRFFRHHPEVDVVFGHSAEITEGGRIIYIRWAPPYSYRRLRVFDYIRQPTAFVRRSAIGESLVDESFDFAMDYELWLRLGKEHQFGRLNRILAVDRNQPDRKSSTMTDVCDREIARLATLYGQHYPVYWSIYERVYSVATRIAGASLIPGIPSRLAFTNLAEATSGLWRRQVASRRSSWPDEYR